MKQVKPKVTGNWYKIFTDKKKELKLTFAQIAEAISIPERTLKTYFYGEKNPPIDKFNRICEFLNLKL